MGINYLLRSLKSIQTKISISKYAGKTVGVDAYGWLYKGIHTCISELVQNQPTTKYVDSCMRRVKMLQSFDVRPFLVFDGGSLPAKIQTEIKRREKRQEYRKLGQELYKEGRYDEALNTLAKTVDVTPEMAYNLIQALRAENVDYVVAPYEADAQLAYLEKKNQISAIITEDSDFLVFGCKTVIYKLDSDGDGIEICRNDFGKVQELNMAGWTDKQFREMTMLSGCDYLGSISGIGLKSAYKYVKKYRSAEKVLTLLQNSGKVVIPPDYLNNFKRAELVFLYQRVFDLDTKSIVTLNPIPKELDITNNNDYIGPEIEPIIAIGIASGELDPFTKEPISKSKVLERAIVLPENSSFYFGGQIGNKSLPAKANWYSRQESPTKNDPQDTSVKLFNKRRHDESFNNYICDHNDNNNNIIINIKKYSNKKYTCAPENIESISTENSKRVKRSVNCHMYGCLKIEKKIEKNGKNMDQLKSELELDDLLNIERMFIEIGREGGITDGIKAGELEGQTLGCEKGFELLQEIGFYDGVVEMWIKILKKGWNKKSTNERLIKQLLSLRELISTFPNENQKNVEFLELLYKIRSKYKLCCSLLGVTNIQKFKKFDDNNKI
ncbi:hypothetical protein Glove_16g90 [Diversispora epigaea]|uniref:Uncharacterized protein n=1 Tax=Diversispora epigaea TaxID=1348612 RepID=A0A397JY33_9GLOM|nr:hypothetical protein Glove_16g90 [Diversispora epigaea]